MPIEFRFDDLDLHEEPARSPAPSEDTGASTATNRCTTAHGCTNFCCSHGCTTARAD